MKAYLKKLENLRKGIVKEAEKRDKIYTNRTEAWQNSMKGAEYEVDTSLMADCVGNIDSAIENIKLILK